MPRNPQLMIVALLANLAKHYRKGYVYPSQNKILLLLRQRYQITMSRATLNRHLRALELRGWFQRVRRHRRAANGSLDMHSTLYKLSRQAFSLFVGNSRPAVDNLPNRVQLAISSAVSRLRQKDPFQGKNKTIKSVGRYKTTGRPPQPA